MAVASIDRIPRITRGPGALGQLGQRVADMVGGAGAVMLVADPGLAATGATDAARASLAGAGFDVIVYSDIKSDPTMAQVDAAADIVRREPVVAVVSLGGGSAMDAGKTVAAISSGAEGAAHYGLAANPFPHVRLANICVPTTSGTGSETTRVSVLSDADGAKVWLWGDALKPDYVLLDPELTVGLPPHLTAATGIDALVHAIEAATNRNASPSNDMFCHEAIRLVTRHLERAVAVPHDLEARGALQWAASLGGIGIDNAGTAIGHNIGHAIASLRPIHHGRAVGLAMLATLSWNVQGDDGAFARVAEAMGEPADAARVPAAFERLLRASGVKVSLAGEGFDDVTPERLAAQMARPENAAMRRSNRKESTDADLLAFATAMMSQS
jgi:alcohol dehydrogenase class IV